MYLLNPIQTTKHLSLVSEDANEGTPSSGKPRSELHSFFPTELSADEFIIWDYMRDFSKLQKGPLCPPLRGPS